LFHSPGCFANLKTDGARRPYTAPYELVEVAFPKCSQ
jgi:hypothetical protein